MKTIAIILNVVVIVYMVMLYANHDHVNEVGNLRMLIQIEKSVGQALIGM
jgi:uncharacterized protein YxeA